MTETETASAELGEALVRMGLVAPGERPVLTRLAGGVSSDIWRLDRREGPVCIKRALPQLRVRAPWFAPVERNAAEVRWMRVAGKIEPDAVPAVIGEDRAAGLFAMAYLDPKLFPVWKSRLLAGFAEPAVAAAVGERLAHIHAATAGDPAIAKEFANDHIFYPIRLEPYLVFTADRHPLLADALRALAAATAANKRALVHGDVSPKNILVGPNGPVFVDAECAWYGDPAFDLAFCLNHMLLKCLARPAIAADYLACFDALGERYLAGVDWEPKRELEQRAARLLPGLFLGRIDGKSPVEYVTDESDRERVREVAAALITRPVARLGEVRDAWATALAEARS